MMFKYVSCIILFIGGFQLQAQSDFYDINHIPDVKIYFEQENWDEILDSLYIDGQKDRLLASIEIDGERLDSIGIRYKGFSSVSINRLKNPFNIKLDYTIDDQKYQGIDKIKLSNVIQDPSFVREVLSYDIARQYMPASKANFAKVFINDVYWGLYTNVEAVNKDFIDQNFQSRNRPFFKCNPVDLDFDGENSNLGNSPGIDTSSYYPFYDMESDFGWTELYQLIDILNNDPEQIESILDVDRTLWMHALNYVLLNFDSYIGYAQNYYLYQDVTGLFNPILWDLNQSFGSYRLSDASEYFDGFNIEQAKILDPLAHYNSVSVYPRPLLRNLFEDQTYRHMYMAHIRTIVEENFANLDFKFKADAMQNTIEEAVLMDENKFYSNDDFYDNLNTTVSDLIDYPGIVDLMGGRINYLQSYPGYDHDITINNISISPPNFKSGDEVTINVNLTGAIGGIIGIRSGPSEAFRKQQLFDDGEHNDGTATDFWYGAQTTIIGDRIQFYIYAENENSGLFSPERAAYEYHEFKIQFDSVEQGLVINEIMAKNETIQADENGEFDDWIELYNNSNNDINLTNYYLSDKKDNTLKWQLPDVTLSADDYFILWADEDGEQGSNHTNFKLSSGGEFISLSYLGAIVDSVGFLSQSQDVSLGRIPNGVGDFRSLVPSFNSVNLLSNTQDFDREWIELYPVPTQQYLWINFKGELANEIIIYNTNGQRMKTYKHVSQTSKIDLSSLDPGIYFAQFHFDQKQSSQTIIITP